MRVAPERLGHDLLELCLNLIDILAGRQAGTVADAKNVGVDRERLFSKSRV